jgi:hypothetical protein
MVKTIARKLEAIQFVQNHDFNDMLEAWGEKFQTAADINAGASLIQFTDMGLLAGPGDWVIFDEAHGSFDVMSDDDFQKRFVVL